MPVGERRVVRLGRRRACFDGAVDGAVELLEGVGEALGVAARVVGGGAAPASSGPGRVTRVSLGASRWPSQSSSGRSEFQASAPAAPSISKARWFLRPALTCETVTQRRGRRRRSAAGCCALSSVVIGRSTRSCSPTPAKVSTGPVGFCRTGRTVCEVGADLRDAAAGDRSRSGRASACRCRRRRAARRPARARGASSSRSPGAASPARSVPWTGRPCRARRGGPRSRASWQSG